MGRRSTIESLPPDTQAAVLNYIRSHRHYTIDEMLESLKSQGLACPSRSALGRYMQKLDAKDALCANPSEGTIVTIVERGTGEVRTIKCDVPGAIIERRIRELSVPA